MRKTRSRRKCLFAFVESLESRQLLSAAPTVTTLSAPTATLLGQAFTVTVNVNEAGGPAVSGGTVDLLNNGASTGLTGTVSTAGVATFNFGAGNALYAGNYSLSAQYVGNATDSASTSSASGLAVSFPTFATQSDGLQVATVTQGTGADAVTGQTITAEYTGFYQTSGNEFDESSAHPPGTFSYTLNASPEQVITGFDEGTAGIKVGETRVLVIPSALGYMDGQVRVFVIQSVGSGSFGASSQLNIGAQPTAAVVSRAVSTPLSVNVLDASGNLVTTDASGVSVSIASGPSDATVSGTTTVAASGGVATFSDLSFSTPGTYTLIVTDGSLTPATTAVITVTAPAGLPALVAFTNEPSTAVVNTTLSPAFAVSVEDANANIANTDSSPVTVSIGSGPPGAVLGGTTTVAAQDGVATFGDLMFSVPGTYTLVATDGALNFATSPAITVTATPPSTVVPTLGSVSLPTAVVAGGKVSAKVPVTVVNEGSVFKGNITVNIFADAGTTLDGNQVLVTSTTRNVSLKPNKTHSFSFHIRSLPASLPDGSYYLLAQVVDPSGATSLTSTSQSVAVAAPFVQANVGISSVMPASIALNKSGVVIVTVANNGNVPAIGVNLTLAPSSDGSTPINGVTLATLHSGAKILPGKAKTFRLHFKVTNALPTGNYFPYLTATVGGQASTVVGTIFAVE